MIWLRRAVFALAGFLALVVLADLLLGVFSVPAAAVEHVLVQAVLWPFVLADTTMMLPHRTFDVLLQGVGSGLFGWFLARAADEGRREAGIALDLLFALPLVLVVLAVSGAGLALAPPVVIGCLVAGGFGSVAVRTGAEVPMRLPPSGLPRGVVRWVVLLGAGLGLTMMGTVLASGPGDAQVPFALLAALEGLATPLVWPWVVCGLALGLLFLARPPQTAPRGSRSVLGRVVAAGLFGAFVTSMFVGWTAPDGQVIRRLVAVLPMPMVTAALGASLTMWGAPVLPGFEARAMPFLVRLGLPVVAALLGLLHTATTGFLGCEDVYRHPAVRVLSKDPGTFALQPVPATGSVVVAFRDAERLTTLRLDGEGVVEHDLNDLDLDAWADVPPPVRNAYPEELGLAPDGLVHVWVEVPPPGDERVRLLLDPSTGQIVDVQELPDACFVSSWLWDEPRDRAVSGCEWQGDLMIEDESGLHRSQVQGAGELEELVLNPVGSGWFAVSLWSHPYLVRIDPVSLTTTARAFIGSFNWGLGADEDSGLLAVPRFVAGQVLFVDPATLEPVASVRAGWGLRPIVKSRRAWLTASTYDGWLYAVDPEEGRIGQLRLGGWVRDLDVLDDHTAVAGGMCGVMAIDLKEWLE